MKNDIFNLNRFGRYLMTDVRNAVSNYGISILVMATLGLSIDVFVGLFHMIVSEGWQGIGISARVPLFLLAFALTLVSAPSKLFGHITEKKAGSAFLTLPVSTLEKTLSMVIVSCIMVPAAFVIVYLSIDLMVCSCDSTCGESLIEAATTFRADILDSLVCRHISDLSVVMNKPESLVNPLLYIDKPESLVNPLLYIDDIVGVSLLFLLGALLFNKSKIAKTIGSIILICMVLSMIATPLLVSGIKYDMVQLMLNNELTPVTFSQHFPVLTWICRNLALADTINDTVINLLLIFLIWLRIRKINH